jgi:hypothetical protein
MPVLLKLRETDYYDLDSEKVDPFLTATIQSSPINFNESCFIETAILPIE